MWLGRIVPVDGIWRSTGVGVRLSPAEADAAAESINQASLAMVHALAGNLTSRPRPSRSATPSRTGYTPMTRNRYRPTWRA
jgi:hypothetical protein